MRNQGNYWNLISGRRPQQRFVSDEPIGISAGIGLFVGSNIQPETKEKAMTEEEKKEEKAKRQFPNSPELYGDPLPVDEDGKEIVYDRSPELYEKKPSKDNTITEEEFLRYPKMAEQLGLKVEEPAKKESAATTVEEPETEHFEEEETPEEYGDTELSETQVDSIVSILKRYHGDDLDIDSEEVKDAVEMEVTGYLNAEYADAGVEAVLKALRK